MDDRQAPLGERVADEAVAPGADELTVLRPGRAAPAASADASSEKAAAMAMPPARMAPGMSPPDEPTLPGSDLDTPTNPSLSATQITANYAFDYPFAARRPSAAARAFSPATAALLGVGAIAIVGIVYALAVLVGRDDWADGARVSGAVAIILAGVTLLVLGLRRAAGRRATAMVALPLLLAAVLVVGGVGAVVASPALHRAQAQSLERARAWGDAIVEYKRAGEHAPSSTEIARVLDESGEAQLAARHYAQAVAAFTTVTAQYAASDPAAVSRANTGAYQSYAAWVRAGRADVPYDDAAAFFSTYRDSPTCDATCKQNATEIEAQTRFQYGQSLAAAKHYSDAIAQFERITGQLAASSYAPKAHAAAATTYLTLGKQKLQRECPAPVPSSQPPAESLAIYNKLATTYGDTSEGQQAKDALAAPQSVTGYLYHPPTNPAPTVYLSKTINPDANIFSDDYTATYDPSSGLFTFTGVAQGDYYLNAIRNDGTYTHYIWYLDQDTKGANVHVGPLCGLDWGTTFYAEK